ncbi:nitric oxide reductase activation protein NorD [Sulfuriferula sp. AH1]|uniref:nitric oxide reductase activation protein NorD n=1 Tax=Sulfuriferula sp. AH1 TaxID=1985873 RepID=UPI0012FCBD66|nr:VWA domain-containing protein [Sulfuriferula sp. AH1]
MTFDTVGHAGLGAASWQLFRSVAAELDALLGQQSVDDLLSAIINIHPRTSAAAVDLILESCLHAARKLGNPHSFKRYLALLEELVTAAPRGLRPMLAKQDILLERLSIGGLQCWARNGIARYSRDFSGLAQYFALENEASWHMLNLQSGNTLFLHERRRLGLYLRALWGREFKMQPFPVGSDAHAGLARSFVDDAVIHLPDTFSNVAARPGKDVYRAAAVHAAAHIVYSRQTFLRRKINPMQNSLIALIEDARVEALVMRDFPGLRNLWLDLYPQSPFRNTDFLSLARRLTRALLDPAYIDDNGWMQKGRQLFLAQQHDWDDPQVSIRLGLLLANDLGQMRVRFNAPGYLVEPSYRDDNRVLWQRQEREVPLPDQSQPEQNSGDSRAAFVPAATVAGQQATQPTEASAEIFQLATPLLKDDAPVRPAFHYAEWDYRLGMERPDRAQVIEQACDEADVGVINTIEDSTSAILSRLKRINQSVRPNLLRRIRKQEEGDELDLDAAIRAAADIRQQRTPDLRINSRFVRSAQPVSVLLLLDLSESTNQRLADTDKTILALARETAVLFGGAVSDLGDSFAIHGFSSNGRNHVDYYRLKDFDETYDDRIRKRLSGMSGKLSTRMGAAARHAGRYLSQQYATRRILLIVSDGEPADIDVTDANYLVHDAAHAIRNLRRAGVDCFGLNLNARTESHTAHIFGRRGYRMLQDISRLPEILPAIYLRLRS